MSTILLIRHGESQSNAGKPTLCPRTVELTENGWRQAEAIARFLQEAQLTPDLVLTSSYKRTKQTAVPTTLAFSTVPEEWPVQEFTYLSSWHEHISTVEDRQPAVEAYWELSDPDYVDEPKTGWLKPESFNQFIERVRNVQERLEKTELDTIVIFSHEQFITAFRWLSERDSRQLTPETMRKFRAFLKANPVPNGAIVQAKYRRGNDEWGYEMITPRVVDLQPVFAK